MDCWDWEFIEAELAGEDYAVTDHGPLHGPVTGFSITRDKALNLVLETTSASNSKSNAIPIEAETVYIATAEVHLASRFGSQAVAIGVIPRRYNRATKRDLTLSSTTETSSIQAVRWQRNDPAEVRYIIEWVENMSGPFLWPHGDDLTKRGERRRRLHSPMGEIVFSTPIDSGEFSHSCVHLFIEGFELFVGVSKAKPNHILKPGFILYKGAPDEDTRAKFRDCLSFCLGNFLLFLGETSFDEEWLPVSFVARSAHALVEDAPKLSALQPAPLGNKYEFEVTPELLGRMASSLYRIYDTYRLQSVLWSYWHALAAPVHMAAAHFGAAIESLQKAYIKISGSAMHTKVVTEEKIWKDLVKKISTCISEANLTADEKRILTNKAQNLNYLPQGVAMERLFSSLGLKIDALENDVWVNRNRAAHGGGTADNGVQLVRENKVLRVMLNRILLAMAVASDRYYDYYTVGRPTRQLAEPVPDDRAED